MVVIFPHLRLPYAWQIVVGDGFVFLVEAAYFALLFRRPRALLWSAPANAASFGTGMLSRWWFGLP